MRRFAFCDWEARCFGARTFRSVATLEHPLVHQPPLAAAGQIADHKSKTL